MKSIFLICVITTCALALQAQSVGIGTNSPHTGAILEIKSSTKGLLLPRTSSSSRNAMVPAKGLMVYDTTVSRLYYHSGASWQQVAFGTIPASYWFVSGTDIYNSNTGNVGIGLTNPPYKLSVTGDTYITGGVPRLRLTGDSGATTNGILFTLANNTTDFVFMHAQNSMYLSRQTGLLGFVTDLVIHETGNIGIGTGTPDTRLTIDNGTDVGPASGGYLQLGPTSSLNIGFDNNEIQARSNGVTSRLVLQNDGSAVQIGNVVAPSGYKVAVTGKVICEEVRIQDAADWPDYVFADDYALRSMDELRDFIEEHKHLPNIPSAAEVESQGIAVGDMQKRMMEKIEELALYILQLEVSCRSLEKEISVLKATSK